MRLLLTTVALVLGVGGAAHASAIPCATVRVVVPSSAGGATDVSARVMTAQLEKVIQKSIVIDNKPGAAGSIGTQFVAQAAPDGCTLLVNAISVGTYPYAPPKLAYDPFTDLVGVGGLSNAATLLVTAPQSPFNNAKELIAASKSRPEPMTFASAGFGTLQHLTVEDIADRNKAKFTHVAYRGGATALTDLMSGRVDFAALTTGLVLPLMNEGKLKALGVVQNERSQLTPNVPTLKEQGIDFAETVVGVLLYAPSKTPKPIIDELEAALIKITSDPAVKAAYEKIGFVTLTIRSSEATALYKKAGDTWAPVIKRLNIQLN